MRGTTKINNNNSLYYITRNFDNLNKVTNQIALERQVTSLEDNPLSANIGMRMLNVISRADQYSRNLKSGIGSLSLTDSYLGSGKTAMDTVRTLTVGAANQATTNEQRAANAIELNEILKHLVSIGNANDGTRYIFGGQQTTTPPLTIVNGRYVNYTGDNKSINIIVDNNTTMAINSTGSAAYGNMTTTLPSRDLNPDICLVTDRSTKLSDLNGGSGVPAGKILVKFSAYPEGLEIDLAGCDTLEDVKDRIESETLKAARALDPAKHSWLDASSLNWHDLQDRYVKVTMNPEHNGISLQEFDLGEPLPAPSKYEQLKGLDYSGDPGYTPGGGGRGVADGPADGETTVYDKRDVIYHSYSGYFAPLKVENFAGNKVADGLGLTGTAKAYDPLRPDAVLDGFLHGRDLNPAITGSTLLADLEGYNDSTYIFTNGAKPGDLVFQELTQDSNNVFSDWNITGLSKGDNTSPTGELYIKATNRGTATAPDILLEIYTAPLDRAKASDLVATGVYNVSGAGGVVSLQEANSSGVGGSVGVLLPSNVGTATMNLAVDFGEQLRASVHVPAFVEEQNADGTPKDIFNIASGWSIRGLDKPPAIGYDQNHVFSTDLDGDISVNYRYDAVANKFIVELSRPSFNNEPATIIASGEISMAGAYDAATPPSTKVVSGRIELVGAPGFEGVKGSVYLELPAGTEFTGVPTGTGAADPTSVTYALASASPAGEIVFGGATKMAADQTTAVLGPNDYLTLTGDTLFKKGQVFDKDIILSDGSRIAAGTPLARDMTFSKGTKVSFDNLKAGTVVAVGQKIEFTAGLEAGTVVPRGSYYAAGPGFPADGMGVTVGSKAVAVAGYDLRATFATIEDLNRAVEEAGVYVASRISADGKGIEFVSTLAGAWLTVSEDYDCYEQMGDTFQQLSALNLSGLSKGMNSDKNGNVYTEIIHYPSDPLKPGEKVKLVSANGDIVEVDPGYYVRVYSDPEQLKVPFADRDNSTLVAEGFTPAGANNPDWDPSRPYDPASVPPNVPYLQTPQSGPLGMAQPMLLQERNSSGVSGTVCLDYYGTRPQLALDAAGYAVDAGKANPWGNDAVTIFPGGLRNEGARHAVIQELDMTSIVPGVNCDYSGTFHAKLTADASSPAGVSLSLYKDTSRTVMTSRNDPNEAPVNGRVTLYEVDRHGNIAVDTNGDRIVAGYVNVSNVTLPDGQSESFSITTGGARNTGQDREANVFATINDIIDALHTNDVEKLHDLIGTIQADIDRIIAARGDVSSRAQRMVNLKERHADDIVSFQGLLTSRVGMDSTALARAVLDYQAATNAYQAAMQVSSQLLQMNLLQYL